MNENEKIVFTEENPLREIKDFYESERSETEPVAESFESAESTENADNEVIGEDITVESVDVEAPEDTFYDTATLFGESEERLKSEFKSYKANKLFARMSLMLNDPSMPLAEFKCKLDSAASLCLNSASVLPNRLTLALKEVNGRLPIFALVSYPYSADDFKTKLCAVKAVARTKAAGVEIPLGITEIVEKKPRLIIKELKRLKRRLGKKKDLTLIVEADRLSRSEMRTLSKICGEAEIKSVKASFSSNEEERGTLVADLKNALGGISITSFSDTERPEEVVSAFSNGAERFSGPNALKIALEIKARLGE